MTSERREELRIQSGDGFARKERVVEYNPSVRNVLASRLIQLLWLFGGVLTLLIGIRVLLKLIAANPGNPFAAFLYNLTQLFLGPFETLVANPQLNNSGAVLEVTSLIAIIVYIVLTWAITALVRILLAGSGGMRSVKTVERN